MRIRLAQISETIRLETIQRLASLQNDGDRDALLAHPEMFALPQEQIQDKGVNVAEEYGVLIGFSAIFLRKDGNAELDGLFVIPDRWKSGIGHALVMAAADTARKRGALKLCVIGNPHAEGFYKKVGFITTGDFPTQFGPGILMELAL